MPPPRRILLPGSCRCAPVRDRLRALVRRCLACCSLVAARARRAVRGRARRHSPPTTSPTPTRRSARSPAAAIRSPCPIIEALQDGRLLSDPDSKKVYRHRAPTATVIDAATGAGGRQLPDDSQPRPPQQPRCAAPIEAALGGLTLLSPDPASALRRRAGGVQGTRRRARCRLLDAALAKETDAERQGGARPRPAPPSCCSSPTRPRPTSSRPIARASAQRGDQEALALLIEPAGRRAADRCKTRRAGAIASIQSSLAMWNDGAERLVRPLARLGAAARRDRARHHLRRDGRHQHGAWRDGDARRLHHLRRAGGDPHPLSRRCSTIRW